MLNLNRRIKRSTRALQNTDQNYKSLGTGEDDEDTDREKDTHAASTNIEKVKAAPAKTVSFNMSPAVPEPISFAFPATAADTVELLQKTAERFNAEMEVMMGQFGHLNRIQQEYNAYLRILSKGEFKEEGEKPHNHHHHKKGDVK